MTQKTFYNLLAIISAGFFLLPILSAYADLAPVVNYVASSSNYRIGEDEINSGAVIATSTNYSINSSLSDVSGGTSTSTSFSLTSGSMSMSSAYLAISTPSNVSMSPAINTSGGGVGSGSASWNVTTDSSGGYSLSVRSDTSPALKSATDSFGNYQTQLVGIPDYDFRAGDGADFFGFTPEGSDISSLYKDDGASLCNTGSSDTTDKCWDSITTSDKTFARGLTSNHPSGQSTTVKFRAKAGAMVHKAAGSYTATIIVTAVAS